MDASVAPESEMTWHTDTVDAWQECAASSNTTMN
jgi:hypothetical protein